MARIDAVSLCLMALTLCMPPHIRAEEGPAAEGDPVDSVLSLPEEDPPMGAASSSPAEPKGGAEVSPDPDCEGGPQPGPWVLVVGNLVAPGIFYPMGGAETKMTVEVLDCGRTIVTESKTDGRVIFTPGVVTLPFFTGQYIATTKPLELEEIEWVLEVVSPIRMLSVNYYQDPTAPLFWQAHQWDYVGAPVEEE
jgi:hypothetical protein